MHDSSPLCIRESLSKPATQWLELRTARDGSGRQEKSILPTEEGEKPLIQEYDHKWMNQKYKKCIFLLICIYYYLSAELLNKYKSQQQIDFKCHLIVPSVLDDEDWVACGKEIICTWFALESPKMRLRNAKQEAVPASVIFDQSVLAKC